MRDDDDPLPAPILACGHRWDGVEAWADMAVIQPAQIDGPDGPEPAVATGHYCRACRADLRGEQFTSLEDAYEWLRLTRA